MTGMSLNFSDLIVVIVKNLLQNYYYWCIDISLHPFWKTKDVPICTVFVWNLQMAGIAQHGLPKRTKTANESKVHTKRG